MLHVPLHDPQSHDHGYPPLFGRTLGELQANGADLVGTEVIVCGFMEANRGKGTNGFVDLRDGTGKTQVSSSNTIGEEALDTVQRMTRESTLQFTGTVALKRPPKVKEGSPRHRLLRVLATSVT